jgi:hypothetical protein
MNELITRTIEADDTTWLTQVPPELLDEDESAMILDIMNYERKWERTPNLKWMMDHHEAFVPFRFTASAFAPEPEPIGAVYERTVNEMLASQSERLLYEVEKDLLATGTCDVQKLGEIQKLHVLVDGAHRYSIFDRSLYFRRGKTDIPFKIINKKIGGLADGDFMLLVGRLGTGKSTIAQWIAKHAWEQGKKILFISAEMLGVDVFSRIDAMVGKFNPLRIRGGLTTELKKDFAHVVREIKGVEGEIIIPKNRLLSPMQISAFAQNLGADLIVVDGAYLLRSDTGNSGSKWENVASVSNQLKQMALDLQIPMIGTAQIKRNSSGADGYDPEDIAYSDALGQDADFVVAIHPNKTVAGRNELQLIKNRYGDRIATQIFLNFEDMTIIEESVEGAVVGKARMTLEEWTTR